MGITGRKNGDYGWRNGDCKWENWELQVDKWELQREKWGLQLEKTGISARKIGNPIREEQESGIFPFPVFLTQDPLLVGFDQGLEPGVVGVDQESIKQPGHLEKWEFHREKTFRQGFHG